MHKPNCMRSIENISTWEVFSSIRPLADHAYTYNKDTSLYFGLSLRLHQYFFSVRFWQVCAFVQACLRNHFLLMRYVPKFHELIFAAIQLPQGLIVCLEL